MNEMLTVEEIARTCRLHEMTIRRHIAEGKLKAVRVGKGVRVRQEDFEAYITPATISSKPGGRGRRATDKPLTKKDAIFGLVGIVNVPLAADLSGNKYAAFDEAFSAKQ